MVNFEFDTREFRLSHNREPRGYGAWAFTFEGQDEPVWAPSSTYSDAKTWVRNHIRTLVPRDHDCFVIVKVCT